MRLPAGKDYAAQYTPNEPLVPMNPTSPRTPIIDSQVHAYERNRPERPWIGTLHGPEEVTGDDMVSVMDAVGVDGALLVSPWSMYRYDGSYALEVHAAHPDRFALIKPFDPDAPDVGEQVAAWAALDGTVGARIVLLEAGTPGSAGFDRVLEAGARHGLPINVLCWGRLDLFDDLARRHPQTQLVLDHLGLQQTFEPPPPPHPFAALDQVIALAGYDNVAIKISGACTLSREAYPFEDIREALYEIYAAYGIERCLWGSDWTRATAFVSYAEAVEAFRLNTDLSDDERAALMGGSLQRIYGWAPGASAAA